MTLNIPARVANEVTGSLAGDQEGTGPVIHWNRGGWEEVSRQGQPGEGEIAAHGGCEERTSGLDLSKLGCRDSCTVSRRLDAMVGTGAKEGSWIIMYKLL